MADWVATLVKAKNEAGQITIDVEIVSGADMIPVTLVYSLTDPSFTLARLRADIEHYANGLNKWPMIEAVIGTQIASGVVAADMATAMSAKRKT